MSTHSAIVLKVKKSDKGKTFKFDENKLPTKLIGWGYEDEIDKDKCQKVTLNGDYIGIYCHWDGYPEGVGEALKNNFKTYEDVLNLIVGGFCSSIDNEGIKHYANRKDEEWEWIKPIQGGIAHLVKKLDLDFEYLYLFENNSWKVKEL